MNSLKHPLPLLSVALLVIAVILGIIAISTPNWIAVEIHEDYGRCDVGLFQIMCDDDNSYSRDVSDKLNACRIILVIALVGMTIGVLAQLSYILVEKNQEKKSARHCTVIIMCLPVLMYLMAIMATILVEFSQEEFFAGTVKHTGVSFGWSMYLSIPSALLPPIGVFIMCTKLHFIEDEEAGVDLKFNDEVIDTYI